jgi:copper chaperone CopZ
MTEIKVPDMHCANCVRRITEALGEAGLRFSVDLESKTVSVDGCEGCVGSARGILEDLGFTPQ